MTTKEKHKWLVDNYQELNQMSIYNFLREINPTLLKLYKDHYSYTFDYLGLYENEPIDISNTEILFINLLYKELHDNRGKV